MNQIIVQLAASMGSTFILKLPEGCKSKGIKSILFWWNSTFTKLCAGCGKLRLLTFEIAHSTLFFFFFRNITSFSHRHQYPTEHHLSIYSLQSYNCCLLYFLCVLKWLPYIWKCHINSSVVCQIHLKFSGGSQPTHSMHPPHWARSGVTVSFTAQSLLEYRTECSWFFCHVQLPWSELGWQLECCNALHASVKPDYIPPSQTQCFTVLWHKQAFYKHRFPHECILGYIQPPTQERCRSRRLLIFLYIYIYTLYLPDLWCLYQSLLEIATH